MREFLRKAGFSPRAGIDCCILLPAGSVLRRDVQLPLAAQENLREVLGFEMDRHTPFRLPDVHYDYRVRKVDREAARLAIDLAVLPKHAVDGQLAALSRLGLQATQFRVDGEPVDDSWAFHRGDRAAAAGASWPRLATACLAIVLAILAAAALYLPIERKQQVLAQYEAAIAELKTKVSQDEALRESQLAAAQSELMLRQRRLATFQALAALEEIARLLGDDSWVLQFQSAGEALTITGYSTRAADLISLLEDSPLLSDVQFSAPVTSDPRFKLERFTISLAIESAGKAL